MVCFESVLLAISYMPIAVCKQGYIVLWCVLFGFSLLMRYRLAVNIALASTILGKGCCVGSITSDVDGRVDEVEL